MLWMLMVSTNQFRVKPPDVFHSLCVLLRVLNQYVNNHVVFAVLCSQICGLLIVAALTAHGNSCFQVELQFTGSFDELI